MNKKCYVILALILMLSPIILAPLAHAAVERIPLPRLSGIYYEEVTDPDVATQRFEACDFDFYPDIIRKDIVDKLLGENNTLISQPGFHVCYIGINTRDYVPDDAGQPDAGRPLAPLNWTDFRQALAWAGLSMDEKEVAIDQIYGAGVVVPAYTIIPEALGVWHNPYVEKPGCNFTKAWEILQGSGFYINETTGQLIQPNGVPVRDSIDVIAPAEAPTSVEFTKRWVWKWNNFTQVFLGVTNCKFNLAVIPFNTEVVNAFYWRDFDMYFLCWGLSRFPDFIYDFFHSSQDMPWGYNSPGLHDPVLDALLEKIKWGLVYEEKLEACYEAQKILVEVDVPYVYLYHRNYWCALKNYYGYTGEDRRLVNAVNMKGTGADNGWTWMHMHWSTNRSGGWVNYIWGSRADNYHPGWADSAYEIWVIGQALEGLTAVNPDLKDIPFISVSWKAETFDWPPLNIYNGTKVTFRIRGDVKWQDGVPFTVEDIKFAWDYMKNFPRFYSTYEYLMWVEIHDPYTITAYLNVTSQYVIYDYAGLAMMFPKHIYEKEGSIDIDPATISYEDWMGSSPATGLPLTALVGTGPYYILYGSIDEAKTHGKLVRNPNYWINSPVKGAINISGRIDPGVAADYSIVITNYGAKPEGQDEFTSVTIEAVELYVNDQLFDVAYVSITIPPFDYVVLDPETDLGFDPLIINDPCVHNLTLKIYEAGVAEPIDVYTVPVWVTLRYDLNLDCMVRIDDVFTAAMAFGSSPPPFPGHERWDERADVNDDLMVRIDDIFAIAQRFGWP